MDGFKTWLSGRGPLVVIILVLAALLGSGYGQTWFGAHAAPLAASKSACKNTTTVHAHFTPGPKNGGVTPIVGSTAVPKKPGVILGMISRPWHKVVTIQQAANAGNKHFIWYRNARRVVLATLPHYGFKPPIHLVSPPKPVKSSVGRPLRKAEVEYQHELFKVYVAQPDVHGPKGVWMIVTIVRQHLRVGEITRPLTIVQKTQKLVDSGKQKFWLYPNAVVKYELPQYGFKPPFTIVQKATAAPGPTGRPRYHTVIRYKGDLYDIYVVQPGVTGKKGIWMITTISPRP
jgi:hypothetical protein